MDVKFGKIRFTVDLYWPKHRNPVRLNCNEGWAAKKFARYDQREYFNEDWCLSSTLHVSQWSLHNQKTDKV